MATVSIFQGKNINNFVIDRHLNINKLDYVFDVFFYWNESVTGFDLSDISVTASGLTSSMAIRKESLRGGNRLYRISVIITVNRTSSLNHNAVTGNVSITVRNNAVNQGNSSTSRSFPYHVRNHTNDTSFRAAHPSSDYDWQTISTGISISSTNTFQADDNFIYTSGNNGFLTYNKSGGRSSSNDVNLSLPGGFGGVAFGAIHAGLALGCNNNSRNVSVFDLKSGVQMLQIAATSGTVRQIIPFQDKFIILSGTSSNLSYNSIPIPDFARYFGEGERDGSVKTPDNHLQVEFENSQDVFGNASFSPSRLTATSDYIIKIRNNYLIFYDSDYKPVVDLLYPVVLSEGVTTFAADSNYIYVLTTVFSNRNLYRLPLSALLPPKRVQLNYPIFVNEGDTINLNNYVSGAERFTWDVDYEPPNYLSLSGNNLTISSNAVNEETAVEVKLKAYNKRGYTDDDNFKLYFVIRQSVAPVWRDINNITMEPNSSYDISRIVEGADSYSIGSRPSGASLSGSILSIGNTAGNVVITARKGSLSASKTLFVDLDRRLSSDIFTREFRYHVEIKGIDISSDLLSDSYPEITNHLDPVNVNEYVVNSCTLTIKGRQGYYNAYASNNFWSRNNLHTGGYLEPIKIYIEFFNGNNWTRSLMFSGFILETDEDFGSDTITLNCVDESFKLKNKNTTESGLTKYVRSFRSTTPSYEGIYNFEDSVLPILPGSATAWSGKDKLDVKVVRNASEGVIIDNSAYVTRTDIRTQGGFLDSVPLLRYKTPYQYRDVSFFLQELSAIGGIANPVDGIYKPELSEDFIQAKGNFAFNLLDTRITHIPRDWMYLASQNKIYGLLSNPHRNYSDLLFEIDLSNNKISKIKEFSGNITTMRLATADGEVFYIATTNSIDLDRSQFPVPRDTYSTVRNYDVKLGAQTKIIKYDRSADSLSDIVNSGNRPQVGLHYHVGAGNEHRYNLYEGIEPENRSTFKIHGNQIFYRFCSNSHYGVARSSLTGTVNTVFSLQHTDYEDHLNFGFDINTSNNTVYIVYTRTSHTGSSLGIQSRGTGGGSTTTLYSSIQNHNQLTTLFAEGGVWGGIHEAKLIGNDFYFIAEIIPVEEYYTGTGNSVTKRTIRSNRRGAGSVLYRFDISNRRLSVIDTYNFVQTGITSLVERNNELYYLQSPLVSYKHDTFNPLSEDDFSIGLQRNIDTTVGSLKKYNGSEVTNLGNVRYSNFPYRSTSLPILEIDNELHIVMGYGNQDEVLRSRIQASRSNNFLWMKYGKKLEYILPGIDTGNVYNLLVDLALKTNSLFSVQRGRIRLVDRDPIKAQLNTAISTTASSLTYKNESKDFPSNGYLLINREIIKYTGKNGKTLTGLTRGFNGSNSGSYSSNQEIVYIDNVIDQDAYLGVKLKLDTNRFYNIVRESNQILEKRDDNLIDEYDIEKVFTLDLGLSRHSAPWIDYMYEKYLENLKKLKFLVTLTLKPSNHIELGDIITFYYDNEMLRPTQVTSITYGRETTQIQGRTL